jgi:hypothetical protein
MDKLVQMRVASLVGIIAVAYPGTIEPGHVISQGDVDVPETLACELYWSKSTRQRPTGFLGRAAGELSPLSDRLLLGEVAALRSRPVLQSETGADGAAFTSP